MPLVPFLCSLRVRGLENLSCSSLSTDGKCNRHGLSLSLSVGRWLTFAGPALSEKLHFKDSNSTILSSAQLSSFFQPKPPADLCPGTYSTLLPPIFLLPWDYFLLATHFRGLRSPVKVISLHTLFCSLGCSESSSCLRICRAL